MQLLHFSKDLSSTNHHSAYPSSLYAGSVAAVYRKSHLFDVELPGRGVSLKESAFTIPGPALAPPVQTPIGKVLFQNRACSSRRHIAMAATILGV